MREVELKAVVPDLAAARRATERAGGRLVFDGTMIDRRYDAADGGLRARDEVLRLRVWRAGDAPARATLDWKGPTSLDGGFKVREELSLGVADADALMTILARLGFVPVQRIDREVAQYEVGDAIVRFERYPRLDDLVEVEGTPRAIEQAIAAVGLPRDAFTAHRLDAFVERFEARTGERAALAASELDGDDRQSRRTSG